MTTLPHDPYITAVVNALTANGLEPTDAWTSDTESNRYDASGLTTQLDAHLAWDDEDSTVHEHGIALIWEHPADQWKWAPRQQHGHLEREPEFLPRLGLYSHPDVVVATVRALLAGEPLPEGHAPYWHPADAVKVAVEAWERKNS